MKLINKHFYSSLAAALLAATALTSQPAHALPVIDAIVQTGVDSVKVYPDHKVPGVYWYIPVSIEPWERDSTYKSVLYRSNNALSFVFRGQASVDDDVLKRVAKALKIKTDNLAPIAYEYSRDLLCQDIFAGGVHWSFPKKIGNYLEVVPVSLRTTDLSMLDEVEFLIRNGGLACTVEVGFKGVYTAYELNMTANFSQVYTRFETHAHAEGLWWEVDIRVLLEKLIRDGAIKITTYQDVTTPLTEGDKRVQAAMDEIMKKVTDMMFKIPLKLPDGDMVGRGKAWSLRSDFRRQQYDFNMELKLNSTHANIKDSQISLRLAVE